MMRTFFPDHFQIRPTDYPFIFFVVSTDHFLPSQRFLPSFLQICDTYREDNITFAAGYFQLRTFCYLPYLRKIRSG
jgi:hypothetical protein